MAHNRKLDKQRKAFTFFTDRMNDKRNFSLQEVADHCGWGLSTPKTYVTKKWKDILLARGSGRYSVRQEFNRISEQEFLGQASQKSPIYTGYKRTQHQNVVIFEFLLPLTREDKLRTALDELFYRDCLRQRIQEVGLSDIQKVITRSSGLSDDEYLNEVVECASVFGGYSIHHVQGRFRAGSLKSRSDLGDLLAGGRRYLMDETTAVVRFIVPCSEGSVAFEEQYGCDDALHAPGDFDTAALDEELRRIRGLFFYLFVEAVV